MPFDPFADMAHRLEAARKERLAASGARPDVDIKIQGEAPGRAIAPKPVNQSDYEELLSLMQPKVEPQPGLIEKWGPTALRGAGMVAGATPLKAFGAGAAGETGAQLLEMFYGNREGLSAPEIAASAVTGGVGGGMMKAMGGATSAATGALRAAPFAVAQPYLAHGVAGMRDNEGGFDPTNIEGFVAGAKNTPASEVAISGLGGTAVGAGVGALQKLMAGRNAAKAGAEATKTFEIEPTIRSGNPNRTITGSGEVPGLTRQVDEAGQLSLPGLEGPSTPGAVPYTSRSGLEAAEAAKAEQAAAAAANTRMPSGTRDIDLGPIGEPTVGVSGAGGAAESRIPYNSGDAEVFQEPRIKAQIAKENAQRQVSAAKQALEEQPPVVSETYRGEGPDGRQTSVTRRWQAPVDEKGNRLVGAVPPAKPLNKYAGPPVDQTMPPEVKPFDDLDSALSGGPKPPPPSAGGELIGRYEDISPAQPLTKAVAEPAIAPIEEPMPAPREVRQFDLATGEPVPPSVERRVTSERVGEQWRGTDLAALQRMLTEVAQSKKPADVTLANMTPQQLNLGGTGGTIADAARDARVAALMAEPFQMSGEDIVAGAQQMRQGFAERAGKGFEKPRGGDPSAAPTPEGVVEAPSNPAQTLTAETLGGTPIPLHRSREAAAASFYRELQDMFGKAKESTNPAEQLGYQAARRQGRLAQAERKGVNTAEVGGKTGQAFRDERTMQHSLQQEPEPFSNTWFTPAARAPRTGKEGFVHPDLALQQAGEARGVPILERLGFEPKTTNPARLAAEAEAGDPAAIEAARKLLTGSPEEVAAGLMSGTRGKLRKGLSNALGDLLTGNRGSIDPEQAARMGLMGAGAVGGAFAYDENPVAGALAGGAIGAALPMMIQQVGKMAPRALADPALTPETKNVVQQLLTPEGQGNIIRDLVGSVPHVMRANMLMSPNLINNALVGPWGSGFWTAMERYIAGMPDGADMLNRMNPADWASGYIPELHNAADVIRTAEGAAGERIGSTIGPEANKVIRAYTEAPGIAMTAGDMNTRGRLMDSGFTLEQAKEATMTSEPELYFPKALVDLQRRGGAIGQIALPFAKTIANVVEQGAHRTPVLGEITQMLRANPDPANLRMVQQGIGGALGAGGYLAGSNIPSDVEMGGGYFDNARTLNFLRSFLSNAAGRYSLPVAMGLAAGFANQEGEEIPKQIYTGASEGINTLPLPSFDVFNSYINAAGKLSEDEFEGAADAPQGSLPTALKGLLTYDPSYRPGSR